MHSKGISAFVYEEVPNTNVKKQYLAAFVVSLGTFCYGTGLGWVSPSLETLQSLRSPLGAPLTTPQVSAVASLFCAGALLGSLFSGLLVDRIGRRWTGLLLAIPFVICYILKLFSISVVALLIARVLVGWGAGGSLLVAPLYCLEIGSLRVRGALGSICILTFSAGILFAYIIGSYLPYYPVLWVNLAISIAYFVGFYFMPESPVYLVKREKYREAAKSIAWLRNISPDDDVTHGVLSNLKKEVLLAPVQSGSSLKNIITSGVTMRALVMCIVLVMAQTYVGIYAILSFVSDIFAEAGSTLSPSNASIVVAALEFFGSYLSTLLIERLGRRVLLIGSFVILGLALAILGTYFHFKELGYDMASVGWIPIVAVSVSLTADATGVASVPFVIINEVFMVQVRGVVTTIIIAMVWINTFFLLQFYSPVQAVMGSDGVFWMFSCISLSAGLYTFFCVPETKGKPLEEILRYFDRRPNRSEPVEDNVRL